MKATIVLLPGDGIGGEVVAEARTVLEAVAARSGHELTFEEHLVGGAAHHHDDPASERPGRVDGIGDQGPPAEAV